MFPLLEGKDREELKTSLTEHGQQQPIVVKDRVLIDGRNRLAVLLELGKEPVVEQYAGTLPVEEYILTQNLFRRHLTDEQRGAIVTKANRWREAKAAETRKKSGKSRDGSAGGRGRKKNLNLNSGSGLPERDVAEMHANSTVGRIAGQAGITRYTAEQQVAVATHAPALADQVAAGTMSLKEAARKANERKPVRAPRHEPGFTEAVGRIGSYINRVMKKFPQRRSQVRKETIECLDMWADRKTAASIQKVN